MLKSRRYFPVIHGVDTRAYHTIPQPMREGRKRTYSGRVIENAGRDAEEVGRYCLWPGFALIFRVYSSAIAEGTTRAFKVRKGVCAMCNRGTGTGEGGGAN